MKKLFLQLCRCRLCYIFLSYRCKRNNQFPNKLLYKLHTLTIPIVLIVPFVAHRQWMLAIVQQRSFTDFPNLTQHAFSQLVMRQTQVCFIPDLNNTRFIGHASQVQSLKFLTYQIYPQTQNMSQEVIFKKNCPPCINQADSYRIPLAIPVLKLKFVKYNTSTQSYVKFSIQTFNINFDP